MWVVVAMKMLKNFSILLMVFIAVSLCVGGFWYLIHGGSALYVVIGVMYFISLICFVKNRAKPLYINSSLLVVVLIWAYVVHGMEFFLP